jgi:hypothetical protein
LDIYEESAHKLFDDHHFSYRIGGIEVVNLDKEFKKSMIVRFERLEVVQFLKIKHFQPQDSASEFSEKQILLVEKKQKGSRSGKTKNTEHADQLDYSPKIEVLIEQFIENEYQQGKSLKNFASHIHLEDLLVKIRGSLNTILIL